MKIEYFHYVEHTSFQVLRMSSDDVLLADFIQKYKLEEVGFILSIIYIYILRCSKKSNLYL